MVRFGRLLIHAHNKNIRILVFSFILGQKKTKGPGSFARIILTRPTVLLDS